MDNIDISLIAIGQRIRDERNNYKWYIGELAERTGLSVGYISSIERGKCNFSVESLIRLSNSLKSDVNYLLFGNRVGISNINSNFQEIIGDCNQNEIRILIENAKILKEILRKNNI